jgi:hypothetical protein
LQSHAVKNCSECGIRGETALREQWTEQAAAIGMTIEEILQAGRKRGRGNGAKHQQETVA